MPVAGECATATAGGARSKRSCCWPSLAATPRPMQKRNYGVPRRAHSRGRPNAIPGACIPRLRGPCPYSSASTHIAGSGRANRCWARPGAPEIPGASLMPSVRGKASKAGVGRPPLHGCAPDTSLDPVGARCRRGQGQACGSHEPRAARTVRECQVQREVHGSRGVAPLGAVLTEEGQGAARRGGSRGYLGDCRAARSCAGRGGIARRGTRAPRPTGALPGAKDVARS